jgi:hypothetical protein
VLETYKPHLQCSDGRHSSFRSTKVHQITLETSLTINSTCLFSNCPA